MLRKRARGERGAVAVEAALITPILVLVLFGIIEMSLLMRDVVGTTSAVRTGARIASVSAAAGPGTCQAGTNPPPCTPQQAPALAQAAADAMQRAGTALPADSIKWVMIYEAGPNGFPVGKTTLECGSNCVTYTWDAALNKFRFASGAWNTKTAVNACVNHADRDSVGVAMKVDHGWATGLFGTKIGITERSVMQFEPLPNDQCMPGAHG